MKPFFGSPEALVVAVAIVCYLAWLGLPTLCARRAKLLSKRPYRWGFNLAWRATEYAAACLLCAIAATALASFIALLNRSVFPRSAGLSLEVASVRKKAPSRAQEGAGAGITVSGNRVTVVNYALTPIILDAYSLKPYQLLGDTDWMGGGNTLSTVAARAKDAATFDISAMAEGEPALTRDQARAILQAVLAERFKLRVHHETRDLSVYALVVGTSGPKLKESARDEPSKASFDMGPFARIVNRKAQISRLADFLSLQADRPVIDRTGLTGFYDFTLEWRFNPGQQSALGLPEEPDPAAPSLLTAVQEQLGLRLEAANAPVQVLVIDHVEPPSEN